MKYATNFIRLEDTSTFNVKQQRPTLVFRVVVANEGILINDGDVLKERSVLLFYCKQRENGYSVYYRVGRDSQHMCPLLFRAESTRTHSIKIIKYLSSQGCCLCVHVGQVAERAHLQRCVCSG